MVPQATDNFEAVTVVAVGSLPPPVHGNAVAFEAFVEELRNHAKVIVADISPGQLSRGLRYHARRTGRVAKAILALLRNRRKNSALYHNVNAGMGLAYSLAIVTVARLLRYRCFLHHHSYSYVDEWNLGLDMLIRISGRNAMHVMLAQSMADAFREQYPRAYATAIVGNAKLLATYEIAAIPAERPLVLGHLSRLGSDKGLHDVLRTFDAMANTS